MGLWKFVRSAGRVLGVGRDEAIQGEGEPAPPAPAADAIRAELQDLGLDAQDVQVRVEGDTVRLIGTAPDASTREKLILAAGNIAGVGQVHEEIATSASTPDPVFHTVKRGDTLSGTAQRHYGSAAKYPAIIEANRPMLTDPDGIYPGQVLRIPPQQA
jgi:nucleoid-associated protein YgaU